MLYCSLLAVDTEVVCIKDKDERFKYVDTLNVLVVDDDKTITSKYKRILKILPGFPEINARYFATKAAVHKALGEEGWIPDIAIMDIDLGIDSGVDLAKDIRSGMHGEIFKSLPLIFISGSAQDESKRNLIAKEFNAVLVGKSIFDNEQDVAELLVANLGQAIARLSENKRNLIINACSEIFSPHEVVERLLEKGEMPRRETVEAYLGIGFFDIVKSTHLANVLLPKDNYALIVEGVFPLMFDVIKKYGGMVNKTEGDSIMYQFGGPLDVDIEKIIEPEKIPQQVALRVFECSIEMQQRMIKLNRLDESLFSEITDLAVLNAAKQAFALLHRLRESMTIEILSRAGASSGLSRIGIMGRQYDVSGIFATIAKRMETMAKEQGVCISADLEEELKRIGALEKYALDFAERSSILSDLSIDPSQVVRSQYKRVPGKRNEGYSFSHVLVNPYLPRDIMDRIDVALMRRNGAADIASMILDKYIDSPPVIKAIERFFGRKKLVIQTRELLHYLNNEQHIVSLQQDKGFALFENDVSLPQLCERLYTLGEEVYKEKTLAMEREDLQIPFVSRAQYIRASEEHVLQLIKEEEPKMIRRSRYYKWTMTMCMQVLIADISEYQRLHVDELVKG